MHLRYGKSRIAVDLPPQVDWQVLGMPAGPQAAATDEMLLIRLGLGELSQHLLEVGLTGGQKVLLVVPDHTRRCRLELLLPPLTRMLQDDFHVGVEIIVANGSHALQPDAQLRQLVGEEICNSFRVWQHDCRDSRALVHLGRTEFGTDVWLNKKVKESDLLIAIGPVRYHYFAGFGGGPKLIFPGLAGYESIRQNHRRSIDPQTGRFHPLCREGHTDDNPLFLDLAEAARLVPRVVAWQLLLDSAGMIVDTAVGPLPVAHRQACRRAAELCGVGIERKADVVLASAGGSPADVNLIQSHKTIHHAFQALQENGGLIVLAECGEGVGSDTFLPYFECASSQEMARRLLDDYQLNGQTALALKSKTERARIILISSLPAELVRRTGLIPARDFGQAWSLLAGSLPANRQVKGYVIPDAAYYLPISSSL